MLTTTKEAVRREPAYGETWQHREIDQAARTLLGMGYEIVEGSLDATGFSVIGPDGARQRCTPESPGESRLTAEVGHAAPLGDNFPAIGGSAARGPAVALGHGFSYAGDAEDDEDRWDAIARSIGLF
jgi:hypothetical protein